jgi:hypothetical protein
MSLLVAIFGAGHGMFGRHPIGKVQVPSMAYGKLMVHCYRLSYIKPGGETWATRVNHISSLKPNHSS